MAMVDADDSSVFSVQFYSSPSTTATCRPVIRCRRRRRRLFTKSVRQSQ